MSISYDDNHYTTGTFFVDYRHEKTCYFADGKWLSHSNIPEELLPMETKKLTSSLYLLSFSTYFYDLRNWTQNKTTELLTLEVSCVFMFLLLHRTISRDLHSNRRWLWSTWNQLETEIPTISMDQFDFYVYGLSTIDPSDQLLYHFNFFFFFLRRRKRVSTYFFLTFTHDYSRRMDRLTPPK